MLALAAAGTAAAASLGLLVKNSISTVSAQVDLARRVGASVSAIQVLQETAKLAGGSAEALGRAIGVMNARLGEAERKGAGPAYEAIKRLGLSISELNAMDADQRIKAMSDRMAELGFTSAQYGDTLRALGVRQQEVINLFMEGSGAIEETRRQLQSWGVLLSDVDAAKIEQAGDAWEKLSQIFVGIGNQLTIRLAPILTAIAEYIADAASEMGGLGGIMDSVFRKGVGWLVSLQLETYKWTKAILEAGSSLVQLINKAAETPQGWIRDMLGLSDMEHGGGLIPNVFKDAIAALGTPPSM
jgi:hypothetical protein